jgi:hypothetical protein
MAGLCGVIAVFIYCTVDLKALGNATFDYALGSKPMLFAQYLFLSNRCVSFFSCYVLHFLRFGL